MREAANTAGWILCCCMVGWELCWVGSLPTHHNKCSHALAGLELGCQGAQCPLHLWVWHSLHECAGSHRAAIPQHISNLPGRDVDGSSVSTTRAGCNNSE